MSTLEPVGESTTNGTKENPIDDTSVYSQHFGPDTLDPENTIPVANITHKATKLNVFSFARPHYRAFHYSWFSFCVALMFFLWFSIAPLLPEVRETLDLTDSDIWISHIASVASNVFMRFLLGPVCDAYGARIPMGVVLIATAIPTALTGLVNSLPALVLLRFFIGMAGSSFVMCQCWSTRMFSRGIVGTANAIVAGW